MPLGSVVQAVVAGRTDRGRRREENQDNFLIGELTLAECGVLLRPDAGMAPGDTRLGVGERGLLMLVADGMGGAAAGRLASGLACTFVLTEMQADWLGERTSTPHRFAASLQRAVERANGHIHAHARRRPETAGMGSTVTVAGVLDGTLYIAQIGDSRAYLTRQGVTTQITRDQSLVQRMIEAGALLPEDAEKSPQASVILQALGVEPTVEVDVTYQQLCQGDSLVLCSDGLHRVVSAEEIAHRVGGRATASELCEELVALANERGGPDNVTVVAARFEGQGLAEPPGEGQVGHRAFPFEAEAGWLG